MSAKNNNIENEKANKQNEEANFIFFMIMKFVCISTDGLLSPIILRHAYVIVMFAFLNISVK